MRRYTETGQDGLRSCSACNERLPESAFRMRQSRAANSDRPMCMSECRRCLDVRKKGWFSSSPEAVARAAASRAAWHALHPERRAEADRNYQRKKKYGITPEGYATLLSAQDGKCAICGVARAADKRVEYFCVDHDHATGAVRGLLCISCNFGIGALGDTVDGLLKAVEYLRGANK